MTQLKPMPGSAKVKRKQWIRKSVVSKELRDSIRRHKKQFNRKIRNGKSVELPAKGNSYRKVPHPNAKWEYVS